MEVTKTNLFMSADEVKIGNILFMMFRMLTERKSTMMFSRGNILNCLKKSFLLISSTMKVSALRSKHCYMKIVYLSFMD